MFDWFCANIKQNVDYLLLEGITIDRDDKPFQTESELEDEFIKTFKETKGINLVYVSGQNIDRLVTIYNACQRLDKIFLVDFYVAGVLKMLNKTKDTIPFPNRQRFKEIKVYSPHFLTKQMEDAGLRAETAYQFAYYNIEMDKLDNLADRLVMLVRPSVKYDLEGYLHKYTGGCFIYSMRDSYKSRHGKTKDFLEFIADKGMPIKDIHTSGPAGPAGLKRMVEAVKPKHIVPMHTFEGDRYKELFEGYDIVRLEDKQERSV
jgi:ribonuclease J